MHIGPDNSMVMIQSLQPFLRPYVVALVNGIRQEGIPLQVISGRRNANVNQEVGGAERSLHLYGLAFDLQVEGYRRDEVHPYFWQYLGEWWESVGGRWGGRFSAPDVNHFDTGVVSLVP
jgi:uncharacterized protein YcbK (DUF882 family)